MLLLALTTGEVFFVAKVDATHPPTSVISLVHNPPALVDSTKVQNAIFPTNVTIADAENVFTWQVTVTYDATVLNIVSMNVVNTYFDQCVDFLGTFKFGTPADPCDVNSGDTLVYSTFFIPDNAAGMSTLAYTMLLQASPPQPQPLTCASAPPAYPCPTIIVKITWRVMSATPGFSSIHILTDTEDRVAGTGLRDSAINQILYNTEDGFFSNIGGLLAPHAKYTVTPTVPDVYPNATLGRSVSFDGTSSTGAVLFSWNFSDTMCTPQPDCSAGTGSSTAHLYSNLANALPSLTVVENTTIAAKRQLIQMNITESDPENLIIATIVNWGDGTINTFPGQIPIQPLTLTHAYTRAGAFNVNVTVTDLLPLRSFLTVTGATPGTMSTASRVIVFFPGNSVSRTFTNTITNILPVLSFTEDKSTAFKGETITLTITASDADGTVVGTSIDWGDGVVQTFTDVPSSPSHSYANKGTYTVRVTVTDDDGGESFRTSVKTILSRTPTASFTFAPASPLTGDTVTFTDGSSDQDGTVNVWSWDFGDGTTSTDRNPTHKYANSGTFTIKLTVTDNDGSTNVYSQTITVQAPPILGSPLVLAGIGGAVAVVLALLTWFLVFKKRRTQTPPKTPSQTSL